MRTYEMKAKGLYPMDIGEIINFLFNTMPGVGILIGVGFVVCLIASAILERKTRKQFKNHEKSEDEWSLFDDDDEEEEEKKGK